MKQKYLIILLLASAVFLMACRTNEERLLDRLNNLTENVEKNSSSWDLDDWADMIEDLEDVQYELNNCELSDKQRKEYENLQSRLVAAIVSNGQKTFRNQIDEFMKEAGRNMELYQNGINAIRGNYK